MEKKHILKSMIKGAAVGSILGAGASVAQNAYKGVQGARKAVKNTLGGMTTLGKKKPSIADMPTIKGGKGAYVSPNTNAQDNADRVKKAITTKTVKSFTAPARKMKMMNPITKTKLKVPTPGNASPAFKELKQKSVDLKYK